MDNHSVNQPGKRLVMLAGAALAILAVSSCSPPPQGNAGDGERWYSMHTCFACHGPNGNDGKGPEIDNPDMGFRRFLRIVRNARSPIMPKFSEEKISTQDVADIYAWLKTK